MVIFNHGKKREEFDEPLVDAYTSLDQYVSDRFDFETAQQLFSDTSLNHKEAMQILREVLPVVRSAEILDEDIEKPSLRDGAQKTVSESLGTTDRTLRNIVNDPVNQAAYEHFKSMQLNNAKRTPEERPDSFRYSPESFSLGEEANEIPDKVIDLGAYRDFKTSLGKINFMNQQYDGFMTSPSIETKAVSHAKSYIAQNICDFPEYQSIDEQLYRQKLSPKDAYQKRQKVLSNLELDMTLKTKQDMFYSTVAPELPFEGRLYAKAVELGKTSLSLKDAENEFERFYLGQMVSYSRKDSDSLEIFRDNLSKNTGYSTTYLQKKLPQTLGASFRDLYQI